MSFLTITLQPSLDPPPSIAHSHSQVLITGHPRLAVIDNASRLGGHRAGGCPSPLDLQRSLLTTQSLGLLGQLPGAASLPSQPSFLGGKLYQGQPTG